MRLRSTWRMRYARNASEGTGTTESAAADHGRDAHATLDGDAGFSLHGGFVGFVVVGDEVGPVEVVGEAFGAVSEFDAGAAVFEAEVEEDFGELVGGLVPGVIAAADDEEAFGVGVLDVLLD